MFMKKIVDFPFQMKHAVLKWLEGIFVLFCQYFSSLFRLK